MIKKLLACLCIAAAGSAHATLIEYVATNLGGTTWEYEYTITNDTLGFDIEEFTIWFDYTLFDNLAIGPGPAGWDPLAIQPDPGLPDDGFFDSLALAGGIASGATLGGFTVTVDYFGAGAPGAQFFEIVDPLTFATLDSGMTVQAQPPQPIPEPGMIALLAAAALAFVAARRRRTPAAAATLAVAAVALFGPAPHAAATLEIQDMELVDRTRISRTVFNYRYRLVATNTAPVDLTDVVVYLGQQPSQPDNNPAVQPIVRPQTGTYAPYPGLGTQIIEDIVVLGTVAAGATVTSTDTFTIQQDRQFQLDPDSLVTEVGYTARVLLTGIVTDEPISFAEVEVTVDRGESGRPIIESGRPIIESYGTTADVEGRYAVEVDFVADPDFVTVQANGVEQQSFVELNSISGSAGGMLDEATQVIATEAAGGGAGLHIDGANFNPLNVTHVSTALTALATDANGGQGFTNDATLAAAQAQVNNDQLIRVAAALKTVIDNPNISLPPGVANTAALLEDPDVFDAFVVDLEENYPGELQAAIAATLDTINVDYVPAEVPERLYVAFVRANPLFGGGRAFTLEQTGDAEMIAFQGETTDASWLVDADGHIEVTLNNPPEQEFFVNREVPPGSGMVEQVRALRRETQIEIVRIAVGVQTDQVLIGTTAVTRFPDHVGVLPDETQVFPPTPDSGFLAFGLDGILPYTAAELANRTYVQDYFHTDNQSVGLIDQARGADLLSFAPGGTGITSRRGFAFTWSIDPDGVLTIDFPNGDASSYVRFARIDNDLVARGLLIGRWDEASVSIRDTNIITSNAPLQFSEAELVDRKYRSSAVIVDNSALLSFDLGRFDFNFFEDGVGCLDNFGFPAEFVWSVDSNGYMVLQRFFDDKFGPVQFRQRSWLPIVTVPGIQGTRYWVLENLDLDYLAPGFPTDPTVTPGRVNFYEVVQDLTGNQPPTPVDDTVHLTSFDTVFIDVVANDTDPDGDLVILTGFTSTLNGGQVQFSFDANGAYNGLFYTPPEPGTASFDAFDYFVIDSTCNAGTSAGKVTINMPVPSRPQDAK